jgi:hypothetical protein
MYDVVVAAHEVARRRVNGEQIGVYVIERLEYRCGGPDAEYVRKLAVQAAHRRAGVPPWRPYIRESMEHATLTRYMLQVV